MTARSSSDGRTAAPACGYRREDQEDDDMYTSVEESNPDRLMMSGSAEGFMAMSAHPSTEGSGARLDCRD